MPTSIRAKLDGEDENVPPLEPPYTTPCRCGHVTVHSWEPHSEPPVLPCCETGECPYCEGAV